jgi:DNA-binding XRE family transcriptional regulator
MPSERTTLRRRASPGHRSFGPEDRVEGWGLQAVYSAAMARKKQPPASPGDRAVIGAVLRDVRRAAGYRSAETAAAAPRCPASRQTIYAYERGGLVPSLPQFLELVEFYVLGPTPSPATGRKPDVDLRALGVAAVTRALALPAYHVTEAHDLIARMQPGLAPERR